MKISKHSKKIAISFVAVLGLLLVLILFDLSRLKMMQSKLEMITKDHNYKSALMMDMRHGIYERQVSLRNIMLSRDPFERDKGKTIFNSYALNIVSARNLFSGLKLTEMESYKLNKINETMVIAYEAQIRLIDSSIYNATKTVTLEDLVQVFKAQEAFMNEVKGMIKLQKQATKKAVTDAGISYGSAKISVYVLGGSAMLFGVLIALFIIRLTETQAREVSKAMLEIESSNELLERRVKERTEELAQARDEALASNKSKDEFLANMSHELRTPLNIILGYSELAEEVAADTGATKLIPDLKKIQIAAHQQLILINSILDISKIEEGKLEIYTVEFDVEKLLSEIGAAAKPLMSKNNNHFTIECMRGIGMMKSDNMRIRQILLNLISNAAKFTSQGEVSLKVEKELKNNFIKFEIRDNGVGISKAYISDVFEKFTQEDSSTTKEYGGSGLGLSISMQLTELLNGEISVESEEGKGTCFTLKLPIVYVA